MSDPLLSQAEIDALLQRVDDAPAASPPARHTAAVVPYDFSAERRVTPGRLNALDAINERFARHLRIALCELLSREVDVTVVPPHALRYGDYVPSLHSPSILHRLRLEGIEGTALLVLEPQLVHAATDAFFGSVGRFPSRLEPRDFTPSEMRVVELAMVRVLEGLAAAWAPVKVVKPTIAAVETNPAFANLAPLRESVLVSSFDVSVDCGSGHLHVTLPYTLLEPIRALLESGPRPTSTPKEFDWSGSLKRELREVEVELFGILAETRINLRTLVGLKAGDVIPIDMPSQMAVRVEDQAVLRGEFGVSNRHCAVKILDVIAPRRDFRKANP